MVKIYSKFVFNLVEKIIYSQDNTPLINYKIKIAPIKLYFIIRGYFPYLFHFATNL